MLSEICSSELEKEIILMQEELCLKKECELSATSGLNETSLLDECRKKLTREVSEHMQTKSTAAKHLNENNELKIQLEISLAATKKVEEENNKNRELLIKLQVQMECYQHERQQLLERCYAAENENMDLKKELTELKDELKQHLLFQENIKNRMSKTETLVNEIIIKQETLNKEQKRLEIISTESLKCTEKLSEECTFQMKFVHEANIGHRKMEEEIIRLMAAFRELKTGSSKESRIETEIQNYTEWKHYQEEMKRRLEELGEDNKRLQEELKIVMEQNEMLENKCFNTGFF